ncbi:hypothetical protein DOY81_001349, partial [Sarcophaga bullata]
MLKIIEIKQKQLVEKNSQENVNNNIFYIILIKLNILTCEIKLQKYI